MRYANQVGSKAHVEVLKRVRVGMLEYQLESIFLHTGYMHRLPPCAVRTRHLPLSSVFDVGVGLGSEPLRVVHVAGTHPSWRRAPTLPCCITEEHMRPTVCDGLPPVADTLSLMSTLSRNHVAHRRTNVLVTCTHLDVWPVPCPWPSCLHPQIGRSAMATWSSWTPAVSIDRYGSDITVTFPANGKFTDKQRGIYEAVLRTQRSIIDRMKPGEPRVRRAWDDMRRPAGPRLRAIHGHCMWPNRMMVLGIAGVSWPEMHRLADRLNLEALRDLGLVRGDIDAMMAVFLGSLFMPHGMLSPPGSVLGLTSTPCAQSKRDASDGQQAWATCWASTRTT